MTDPGGETQISGAITAVPPVPRYEDEEAESLGEKLAELYARRDRSPKAKVEDTIEATRRQLRRGPRLRAGEFLKDGRYRLIERLGDTAGDATWKAWDRTGQRLVVVKEMVGPWVSKKMRVGTFLEAARTLQGIEHAGLARVIEASQSRDGFVYVVTDHFEGGTLEQGFSGDQIDLLQVIVEVGNALQAAHELELVHARVMPNNIHFDEQGGAHLSDFDLAGEHTQEERGSVYVAPETVERGSRATPSSDVYSLAMCALFGLNGGKLPYTVVRAPERFIKALDAPDSVKAVLERGVEWDLDRRFPSARAFVDALLSDPEVLEQLAARALERGRHVIASEHYTALWSARPERSVEIKRVLGTIYLSMQAWEEAYTCLATALEEAEDPEPLYAPLREYAAGTGSWKRVADLLWNQARERRPIPRASIRAELARLTEEHLGDAQGAAEMWMLVLQDHRLPSRAREALEALARLAEARGDWPTMIERNKALLPYLDADDRPQVQYAIGRAVLKHVGDEDEGLRWVDLAEAGGVKPLDMATDLQDIRARRGQWRRVIGLMRLEADHEEKVHAASRILLRAATIARSVHLDAEAEGIYENLLERAPQHYPALRALARMRDCDGRAPLAMEAYERLTATYEGRSEEPEASERASDHTAYARLLIGVGRHAEAIVQLEAALALQPDNVEALRSASSLYVDLGRVEEGAQAMERLYALFKAVSTAGTRLEAALQRADAAWYRGRLAVAMRWFNTVLDAAPNHPDAWWGLAKVALAARSGHPGVDRAPWLANTPARTTPQEALARLFMGMFTGPSLADWITRHPLGAGVVDAGASPARLACAAVDLLVRYDLVDAAMFARLRAAQPAWAKRIDLVEAWWSASEPPRSFDPARGIRWARSAITRDFDAEVARTPLARRPPPRAHRPADFGTDEHWDALLATEPPADVAPPPPPEPDAASSGDDSVAIQFHLADVVEFTFEPDDERTEIGSDPGLGWTVSGLEPRHALLRRVGDAVYLERVGDAEVRVDGELVTAWRVVGGETLQLGSNLWDVRLAERQPEPTKLESDLASDFEDSERLVEPDPDAAWEALQPAEEALPEDTAPPVGDDAAARAPAEPVASADAFEDDIYDVAAFGDDDDGGEAVASESPVASDEPGEPEDSESSDGPVFFDASEIQERFVPGGSDDDPDDENTVGPEAGLTPLRAGVVLKVPAATPAPAPARPDRRFVELDQLDVEAPPHPGSDYEFEEEDTVVKTSPLLGAALRLSVERQPPEEDSLGPAGDAPLPQYLHSRAPEPDDDEVDVPAYFSAASRMEDPERDYDDEGQPSEGFDEDPFASAPAPRAPRPRADGLVEIMSGPARGTQVGVRGVVALGRDESCEIHLPTDPMLAPLHCRFVQTDDGFLVMDNGTDRGTVVNGSRVSEAVLTGGETIMVGSTVLRFQVQDA